MKTVQSLERSLDILLVFTHEQPEIGIVEICKKVELSKGTVFRLVYTLLVRGFLSQNKQNGKYSLGPKAFEVGSVALSQMEIRKVAYNHLEELRNTSGETVHLVIQDNAEVLYIDKYESSRSIRMSSFIGQRMPMYCTAVGKVLLANLSDNEVESICRMKGMNKFTPNTITNLERLKNDLGKIREQGYGLDDEENESGLRCIAAPIRNPRGQVIAAISISAPIMRMSDEQVTLTSEILRQTADKISFEMGYRTG